MSFRLSLCVLATAASAVITFASIAAVAASKTPVCHGHQPPVIYVWGEYHRRGTAMIDVRSPGIRGYRLNLIRVFGSTFGERRHTKKATDASGSTPPHVSGLCHLNSFSFGKDADLIKIEFGHYSLEAQVERISPPPSAFTPASVFTVHTDFTVRAGRCYKAVMACDGDATNESTCHVKLKPKTCEPLRSPRRIVVPMVYAC